MIAARARILMVGDFNPPVLHVAFIGVVIGDGPRLAVAFRGRPPKVGFVR
jgi:hypothetical protein